jgi:hypothetical protein
MISLNGISLNGCQWVNEFSGGYVSQQVQRTLSGSVVVYHGQRTNGIPISIESGSDYGFVKRSDVVQIQELVKQSGVVMSITLRSETYSVIFDQANPFEATPIFPISNPEDNDDLYYRVKVNLITV